MADEPTQQKVAPKTVDLNDLNLVDEAVTIDPEADAFQFPPPVPDGDHLAKLKLGNDKMQFGYDKNGHPYYMAHIEARLVADGQPYNDQPVFDRASTTVFASSGTSRLAGLCKVLGVPLSRQTSIKEVATLASVALSGEPLAKVTTQWEAYCSDCDKRVLKGMRRFPQKDSAGAFDHEVKCPVCGAMLSAQARIVKYAPTA